MANPLVPFGIAMLGTVLGAGSVKKPGLVDPRVYADELLYEDAEIASDLNMLGRKVTSRSNKAIGDIKQTVAANRLPEGAAVSAIAGTQQEAAEGISTVLPSLKREKRMSHQNYVNMVNQYEMAKAGYDQASMDRMLQGVGNLGYVANLWAAGLI